MKRRLLVVDSEPLKRIALQVELSERGYEVYEAADAAGARRIFDSWPVDAAICDVRLPDMSGLDLLVHIRRLRPECVVILTSADPSIETAVLAIKRGAYDYLSKPFTTAELLARLETGLAAQCAERRTDAETFGAALARSASMRQVFAQLRAVGPTDRPVLLRGESGTGKSLLARALHDVGPRAPRPFVEVCCTGTHAAGLEVELFGQQRAGAARNRTGACEAARGGTLVLDHVHDLPPELHGRVERLLDQGTFQRCGGLQTLHTNVRVVATTQRDLLELVREGRFREGLYHRLNAVSVLLPPLRERPDDIAMLAGHFAERRGRVLTGRPAAVASQTIDELVRYAWPGNVRELEQAVERAVALSGGGEIRPEHVLPLPGESDWAAPEALGVGSPSCGLSEMIGDIERRLILMALRSCNGNQARAAHKLGIPRTTLRDKMAKYAIPAD